MRLLRLNDMTYKGLLDSEILKEVFDAPNGLIGININDTKDLFQQDGEIHVFDVSVDASKENRMALLMNQIKRLSKCYEPYNRALVFFYFPEALPLLMEELKPFCEWIEYVPGEFMIKWGMATQSAQELRAIVLLQ